MMEASFEDESISIELSKSEALVLFEWLSRNWERTQWDDEAVFRDIAEKQILILLEGSLQKILAEPFDENYSEIIVKCYRDVIPNPEDWE